MKLLNATIAALALTACSAPPATMQIKRTPDSEPVTLIGTYSGGVETQARLEVSNGELVCVGSDPNAKTTMGWSVNRTAAIIAITCNDGRTGSVTLQTTTNGVDFSQGIGIGKLSDGSSIKVVVGEIGGILEW